MASSRTNNEIDDTNKELAKQNRYLFNRLATSERIKWQKKQQKGYDFFLNDQLTEEELEQLESAGMPTFTVNKITKAVERLQYFMTANNPQFTFAGREGSDVDLAAVWSALKEYTWDISSGKSVFGRIIQNALTKSIGYFFLEYNPNLDNGMGDLVINSTQTFNVYPDPSSSDILFRDAAYILIKKDFVKRILINKLPTFKDKILDASGQDEHSITYSDRKVSQSESIQPQDITTSWGKSPEDDYIDYYELYKKVRVPYMRIVIRNEPTPEELETVQKRIEADIKVLADKLSLDLKDQEIEIADKLEKGDISEERAQFEALKLQRIFQETIESERMRMIDAAIKEIVTTEIKVVSKDEYGILSKNKLYKDKIVNAVEYWETRIELIVSVGTDTFLYKAELPISEYPIIPVPCIHTGTPFPMSWLQLVIGRQREITKAHQLMIHNVSLGTSLRWKYKEGSIDMDYCEQAVTTPAGFIPVRGELSNLQEILPMPLPTAFQQIIEKGENDIEESLGSTSIEVLTRHETARGVLAGDEMSTRPLKSWMSNVVEPALEHLAKVWIQYAQAVYTEHKIFRIVEPDTRQQKEFQINVPIYDRCGHVIRKTHDIQATAMDVKIISGSTLPVNRWAILDMYRELHREGIIDDIAVMEQSDIKNKERVIERTSQLVQLQRQVQGLTDAVKDRDGTIETLKRQVIQSEVSKDIKDRDAQLNKAVANQTAEISAIVSKFRADTSAMIKSISTELDFLKKTVKREAETKAESKKTT